MRRHRSRRHRGALLALLLALPMLARPAAADAQLAEEGALFLLVPVGARAIGTGQAVVAEQMGSEAVWWNPAGTARAEKREVALYHSQTIVATGDVISVLVPSSLLGVFALSINVLNFGEQQLTDSLGAIGSILPRSFVYAATYATPLGSRLSAGMTYKVVQLRFDCSGSCAGVPAANASTSAMDFGAQADLAPLLPVTLGVAVRNVGLRLQVNDQAQSDPIPTRIQVGVRYQIPGVDHYAKGADAHLTGDLFNELRFSSPTARIGLEVAFEHRVFLRTGYDFEESEASGPAVGLGLSTGNLVIDLARSFQGLSADAGQPPTYLSLRYLF